MKILVVGSGFAGLSVAIRLQNRGHNVILIEKRDKLGGRAYLFEKDGFKFDAGPTVITAPWLFDEIFESCGKKREDYVEFIPLDPFYKIFFENGKSFTYNGIREEVISEIRKFNPDDVDGYLRFFESTKKIFKTGFELIDTPFNKISDMFSILPDLIKLRSYQSVYNYVSKFIKNDELRKVFSFHSLLIGGNPFRTTNIYTLIHFLEQKWGVWYAKGGTYSIIKALEKLFVELGGVIRLNTEMTEILADSNFNKSKVKGIKVNSGEEIYSDLVVCNSDVTYTYKNNVNSLYRKKNTDKKIDSFKHSMSLFVIYFGTKKKYENIPHHSIIFGKTYKELLDEVFNKYSLSDDFSLYLHRPTASDTSVAPENHDCFYVLSPVPNLLSKTNWKEEGKVYKDKIISYLEKYYIPDLKENIVTEFFITPEYFLNSLNSYLGSAFSVEPILMQSAFMRPHNESEDIENLYFCGAGTHPGAGLPGVLSSAKIVEKLIIEKYPV